MANLTITGLTFGYDGSADTVFENVNLQLDTTWRLGFIGRNGRGKTTLLRLLAGELDHGGVDFTVERGDRIALRGPNGSGKTSLLRLLMGEAVEHRGELIRGAGLTISCVPQDTGDLSGGLRDFAAARGLDESLFKAILRKLDFSRGQFDQPMERYSAGQRKKVLLAGSLCERAHLYIWDEPLNYIDLISRTQIEQLITQYAPTMVFVEHDGAFVESVATKVIAL